MNTIVGRGKEGERDVINSQIIAHVPYEFNRESTKDKFHSSSVSWIAHSLCL